VLIRPGQSIYRLTITIAVLAAGAMSAAAPSAHAATELKLTGGPVSLGRRAPFPGYRMIFAVERQPHRTVLAVELVRTAGGGAQEQFYSFPLAPGALRVRSGLGEATLDTGSALGRFGRIRMTFACLRAGRGSADHRARLAATCIGTPRHRTGTLTGRFDLRSDVGVKVRERSLPATLAFTGKGGPADVKPPTATCPRHRGPTALTFSRGPGLIEFVAGRQRSGPPVLAAIVLRRRPPASELAVIESPAPRRALTTIGLRSASVSAARVPFLEGRLEFTRTGPLPGCAGRGATGTVSGSLRARFDFFGTIPALTAPSSQGASLIR
jgi:hypothetical protein